MTAAQLRQWPKDAPQGVATARSGTPAYESLTTRNSMHQRLVLWGWVLLQGPTGEQLSEDRDREPLPKTIWTRQQEDAAWATDQRVNALDPKPRIVLRVFYRAWQAECWDEFKPEQQREIEGRLCREVNARWRVYCCEVGQLSATVRAYQLRALRDAAIRELCESA